MHRREVLTVGLLAAAGCSQNAGDDTLDERGELEIVIDGEPVDLTEDRFQAEHADDFAMAFHLHEFDEYWYMEGDERVTVGEGIDLLPHFGFDAIDGAPVITVDGETYDSADSDTEIAVRVNGQSVDPVTYELQDGDDIDIEITRGR